MLSRGDNEWRKPAWLGVKKPKDHQPLVDNALKEPHDNASDTDETIRGGI